MVQYTVLLLLYLLFKVDHIPPDGELHRLVPHVGQAGPEGLQADRLVKSHRLPQEGGGADILELGAQLTAEMAIY